jgi:hypothetical protein
MKGNNFFLMDCLEGLIGIIADAMWHSQLVGKGRATQKRKSFSETFKANSLSGDSTFIIQISADVDSVIIWS